MVKVVIRLGSKTFNNLKDLEKYLQAKINESLKSDVADAVCDELESSALEMLSEYEPLVYERRSSSNSLGSGGIADKNTMSSELISSGVLIVTPKAERNMDFSKYPGWGYDTNKSLAENLIEGYGNRQYPWNQPRDFIEDTRENLRKNKNHVEAMRDGLEEIFGKGNVI
jgi:hypothetical protein